MMKEKINKTNVARLLDKAKIAYQLVPYEDVYKRQVRYLHG